MTTQRDSSLTKETNWLGIFSRHESFNAREEEDREALGIRLRLLMGDGDYPLEKCIYTYSNWALDCYLGNSTTMHVMNLN